MTYAKSAGIALLSAGLPGIAVAQSTFELGEIVVLPLAVPVEEGRTGASVETLGETDLEEAGDIVLGEQLARLPGVNLSRQGGPGANADIQIRGARTRYVAIYVDGILVTDPAVPTTQFDDFGGFTIGNVDRVEILKGSQSALYGGTAVGGVISVSTLGSAALGPGTHQEATVEGGSYGTLGAAYSITRNTERGSFTFGASTARSDGISAADENDGNTEADGFDRTRFTAAASYDLTDRVTVGANAFIETGRTEFDEFGPADGAPPFNEVSERDAFGRGPSSSTRALPSTTNSTSPGTRTTGHRRRISALRSSGASGCRRPMSRASTSPTRPGSASGSTTGARRRAMRTSPPGSRTSTSTAPSPKSPGRRTRCSTSSPPPGSTTTRPSAASRPDGSPSPAGPGAARPSAAPWRPATARPRSTSFSATIRPSASPATPTSSPKPASPLNSGWTTPSPAARRSRRRSSGARSTTSSP